MTNLAAIARKMTPLRRMALDEIAETGEVGLGFGRCSLQKRRELLAWGLTERLPSAGFFQAVRERLTPLGKALHQHLRQQEPQS